MSAKITANGLVLLSGVVFIAVSDHNRSKIKKLKVQNMNKKLKSNSSAETAADSDKTPKVPTSSHACSNTFVIGSQGQQWVCYEESEVMANHKRKKDVRKKLEKVALTATKWLGSIESLLAHTALFILSILMFCYICYVLIKPEKF